MSHEEAIREIVGKIDAQERNYRPAIRGNAEMRAPLVELADTARRIAAKAGIEVVTTKETEMESDKKKVGEGENDESNSGSSEATDSDDAKGSGGPGILDPTDPGVGSGPPESPPEPPPQGGGS